MMGEKGETLRALLFDDPASFGTSCLKTKISLSSDVQENFTKYPDRQSLTSRDDVFMLNPLNHTVNGITFNSPQATSQPCSQHLNQAGESSMHHFSIPRQILPNYTSASVFHSPSKSCASIPTVTDGNYYRPPRPASTPGNNLQNSSLSDINVFSLANHSTANQMFQEDISPKTSTYLKHCPASFPQGLNQKLTHEMQMSSLANKHGIHKLSEVPNSTSFRVSCYNPLVISPVYQNSTPKLDPNTVFSHSSGHFNSPMNTRLQNVPVVDQTPILGDTCKNSGQVFKCHQFDTVCGSRLPLAGIPSTLQTSGSIPSQLHMSDPSNASHPISEKNTMQSYASLVPWTSKLTAPGYQPLPLPAVDAMPIPLENTEKGSMLSLSPSTLSMSSRVSHTRNLPIYSRLRPDTVNSDLNIMTKLKNGLVRNSSQIQKIKCKALLNKEHRFKKTADALQKSGLWEVAMKTGNLIKRNQELQRELELFRADALAFLKSVIKNPQNRDFIKHVLNNALSTNSCSGSSVMSVVVSAAAVAAASAELESCGSSSGCDSDSIIDSHLSSTGSDQLSECSAPVVVAMDMK